MLTTAFSFLSVCTGLIVFSSCATNSILKYDEFLKTSSYTHIQSGCYFFDFHGKLEKSFPGQYCQIYDNGDIVAFRNPDVLTKFDKNLKVIWESHYLIQHQVFKSNFNSKELLAIESNYSKSEKSGNIRTDSLLVIDEFGKISKKFNFKEYIEKNRLTAELPNSWTIDGNEKASVEQSHLNSFYETYRTEGSVKILTGYVAHCNLMNKIFILNKELTQVIKEVIVPTASAHSVRPKSENEFIFYVNELLNSPEKNKTSEVWTYNKLTNAFLSVYKNKNTDLFAPMRSSVQTLTDNKLFILNGAGDIPNKKGNYFEFVDLDSNYSFHHKLGTANFGLQDGFLIDAKDFFKNNIGI